MKRRLYTGLGVVAAALLLAALGAAPAAAAPPLDVHIEVMTDFVSDPDPFVATGSAVDAGQMCPTGSVYDTAFSVTGNPHNTSRILRVTKRFICDNGMGTFDVKLVVYLDLTNNQTTAVWHVIAGTEKFAGMQANGKLVGIPIVVGESILDIYDGNIY